MVDISAVAAAMQSLKTAGEMAQALIGIRDAKAFLDKAIELNRKVLEAHGHAAAAYAAHLECTNRVRELEEQLVKLEQWEAEKQRYELKEVSAGAFAYAVKESDRGAEPVHWLCAACFQNNKKSIMQFSAAHLGETVFACPACKGQIHIRRSPRPNAGEIE